MRTEEWGWPFRERLLDVTWALFALANLIAMGAFPAWETVPFHFIWVSLTIVYGFRVWRAGTTVWTLGVVMILTGTAILHDVTLGAQPIDEITEVPLMAAMFVAMVWHARRRLTAMQELERVSDANRLLLEREKRFVQDASHQLRTPITIALGHAELIERGSAGEQRDDARVVVEELLRLRRLADLLLSIAAHETGKFGRDEEIEVDVIVADTVRRWSPTPRRWAIDELDRACVLADRDQLQLVLDALIDNAVAHTGPGDSITLGVRRRNGAVAISVADTGAGIDRGDLDRVFDRFVRSNSTPAGDRRGLGLGLSMVKSMAESHGGSVGVTSVLGEGSVFELALPAIPPGPEDDEPEGALETAGPSRPPRP